MYIPSIDTKYEIEIILTIKFKQSTTIEPYLNKNKCEHNKAR